MLAYFYFLIFADAFDSQIIDIFLKYKLFSNLLGPNKQNSNDFF